MSVQVYFEADRRLTSEGVVDALRLLGAQVLGRDGHDVCARFTDSGMPMDGERRRNERLFAEEAGDAAFEVSYRCVFTIVPSAYERCMAGIDEFAEAVANMTGAHFVVSWQFERTLITNTKSGLVRYRFD